MLVPDKTAQPSDVHVDRMRPPGAEISGFMRPSFVGPHEE